MDDDEESSLNLAPQTKKLLKTQWPNIKVRPATLNVLALCGRQFMELLVQASAQICEEKDRSLMDGRHVISALQYLKFNDMVQAVEEKNKTIAKTAEDRKKAQADRKGPEMTEQEARELQEQLHRDALAELAARAQRRKE
jgi:hypothetical protein